MSLHCKTFAATMKNLYWSGKVERMSVCSRRKLVSSCTKPYNDISASRTSLKQNVAHNNIVTFDITKGWKRTRKIDTKVGVAE